MVGAGARHAGAERMQVPAQRLGSSDSDRGFAALNPSRSESLDPKNRGRNSDGIGWIISDGLGDESDDPGRAD